MSRDTCQTRRSLIAAGAAGVGLLLVEPVRFALAASKEEKTREGIGPVEDLMREHGVLRRVLLIYDEVIRRLDAGKDLPPGVVADAAGVIRRFVEDYHEKNEEQEIFPRLEKAGKLVELVKVLYAQHRASRGLTEVVLTSSTPAALANAESRRRLGEALRRFTRIYRPHAAREDTVLFPAFRSLVSPKEFAALGEKFENKEHELFGEEGFEKMVNQVAGLEKKLGIYDLSQFTSTL
ncbi:MAG: hemerythrin domain-containing protein [Deltaproteobacteria bacterium]|nr:hemerythrin domain-containing protein [Deltaproteobacteria bacterium]